MTREQIIAQAIRMHESRPGYHYDRKLIEAAVDRGLLDGDLIYVDSSRRIVVRGEQIQTQDSPEIGQWIDVGSPKPLGLHRDRLLVVKAHAAALLTSESHSLASLGRAAYPGGHSGGL